MAVCSNKLDVGVQGKGNAGGKGGGGGMFRGLIDTIIGNLQLSIGNVHVRYEASALFWYHVLFMGCLQHAACLH